MISLNSHTAVSRNTCWLIDDTFSSNVVQFKGFPQLNLMKSPCCAQRYLTCFKLWLSLNIISLSLKICATHSRNFYRLAELKRSLRGQSSSSKPGIWGKGSMPGSLPTLSFPRFSLVGSGPCVGQAVSDQLLWLHLLRSGLLTHQWRTLVPGMQGHSDGLGKHWTLQSQQTGFQVQFSIN